MHPNSACAILIFTYLVAFVTSSPLLRALRLPTSSNQDFIPHSLQNSTSAAITTDLNTWPSDLPGNIPMDKDFYLQIHSYGRIISPTLTDTIIHDLASLATLISQSGEERSGVESGTVEFGMVRVRLDNFTTDLSRWGLKEVIYTIGARYITDGPREIKRADVVFHESTVARVSVFLRGREVER